MQIRPVCPVYIVEREIAQVEHEDFLGGSFAVVRSRKIILEGSGNESSACGCATPCLSIYLSFSLPLSFFFLHPLLSFALFPFRFVSFRFVSTRLVSFCPVPSRFVPV